MAKAVTAKFEADFSSFLTAARAAEGALTQLVQAAGVTESRVASLARSFSGQSIVKEALSTVQAVEKIGGVSKLTASEMERVNRVASQALEKMRALGIEASPELQKLADATRRVEPAMAAAAAGTSVFKNALAGLAVYLGPAALIGAFVGFAKGALDAGDALVKASDKTGISIDALQELSFIADQSGNSIEDITSAINQMQNRLASGDQSAVAAIKELGLSLEDVMAMTPDQQFYAIGKALQSIQDPAARVRLGIDVLGQSAKTVMPSLLADLEKLRNEAPKLSDSAARGLDDFGDMMSKIWLSLKNVTGEVLNAVIGGVRLMVQSFGTLADVAGNLLTGNFKAAWNAAMGMSQEALPEVRKASTGAASAMEAARQSADKLAKASTDSALAAYEQEKFIRETNEAVKQHAQDVAKAEKAQKTFLDSVKNLATNGFAPLKAAIDDAGESLHDLPSESFADWAKRAGQASAATEKWKKDNLQVIPTMVGVSEATKKATASTGLFGDILGKLGPTIMSAIQGGGDIGKSIGSMVGESFGSFFSQKAASATSGFFASKLGSVFGTMMPGLGALAGQLLGAGMSKAMGWITGLFSDPMRKEIEAANKEIDKLRNTMLTQVGGSIDQLEEKYNALGLSIREAFTGSGKQGLEALKAVQEEFNKRLEESKTKLADLRGEFKNLQGELDGLIKKAYEMGYVFNQQGDLIGFNFDKVAEVAKAFGVDLASLGPAFQQAQLTAEAQKVIDGFTLLVKAGADVGAVLTGMKDEINKIVQDSLKFGTVIPGNMRPWIEELIRTGQLTDANGQKITDISQIKFGDPVKSEYDKITDSIQTVLAAMQKLIDEISGLVAAIDQATRPRTLVVTAEYHDPGAPPGFGDPGSGGGDGADQERAIGSMGATGSWFENFGPGRLVRLHGQEAVVRRDQAAAFAADMGGGGGVAAEVSAMRSDMLDLLPRAIARSVRDALLVAG